MHGGERHLGRRDGPQVVALDVVGLVGELGQVAGRHHGLGADQRRRPDLLEGLGVAVEGEGGQRTQQPGARSPEHREHRARRAWPRRSRSRMPSGVADLPVRDPLVLGVGAGRSAGQRRTLDVVLGPGPVGGLVGGQVGQHQQRARRTSDWAASASSPATFSSSASLPALRGQRRRRGVVAGLAGLAHLAGELLDLGPQLVAPADRVAGPGIGGEEPSTSTGSTPRRASAALTASGSSLTCRMSIMVRPTVASPPCRPTPPCECRDLVVRYGDLDARSTVCRSAPGAARSCPARAERRGQDLDRRDPRGLPAGRTPGSVRVLGLDPSPNTARWWRAWA